jgi:hypothetical protein
MLTIFAFASPYGRFLNSSLGGFTNARKNSSLIRSRIIASQQKTNRINARRWVPYEKKEA